MANVRSHCENIAVVPVDMHQSTRFNLGSPTRSHFEAALSGVQTSRLPALRVVEAAFVAIGNPLPLLGTKPGLVLFAQLCHYRLAHLIEATILIFVFGVDALLHVRRHTPAALMQLSYESRNTDESPVDCDVFGVFTSWMELGLVGATFGLASPGDVGLVQPPSAATNTIDIGIRIMLFSFTALVPAGCNLTTSPRIQHARHLRKPKRPPVPPPSD